MECILLIACISHDYYQCYDGDVYWYNCCDEIEEKKEECGESGYAGSDYCYDNVKNYDEVGVHCGGPNCPACVQVAERRDVWKYVIYGLCLLLLLLIMV